ncbi:MAG: hypothetical protein JXD23_09300, partial [Spirochaetales bacterium]|nr:hypothetical protein [Spirochaetales bacterium]
MGSGPNRVMGLSTKICALRFTATDAPPLTRYIGYDYCNRVTQVTESGDVSLYTYDPSGKRVSKVEGDTTTLYFFTNYELEIDNNTQQQTQILYY